MDSPKDQPIKHSNLPQSSTNNNTEKIKTIKYDSSSSSLTWKEKLYLSLKSQYFKLYAFIITLVGLFLDDIQKITTSKDADLYFDIIHILLSLLIFIEIIIYFIADESYGFSLFFFTDIIFLISLILEIAKVYDKVIYYEKGNNLKTNMDAIIFIKVTKIMKIFRIVRIGKIVTMLNHSFLKKNYDDNNEIENLNENDENISSTFINYSSYNVFIFYVLTIIAVIVFDQELYYENPIYNSAYSTKLYSNLTFVRKNFYSAILLFNSYIEALSGSSNVLIFSKFDKFLYINDTFLQKLRRSEQSIFYKEYNYNTTESINIDEDDLLTEYINTKYFSDYSDNYTELSNIIYNMETYNDSFLLWTESNHHKIDIINSSNYNNFKEKIEVLRELDLIPSLNSIENKCISVYDSRFYTRKYCRLNLIRTIFSIGIFLFMYLVFLMDINNIILAPIENIIKKIKKMSKNPSLMAEENNQKNQSCISFLEGNQGNYKIKESQIIETKISKICSLVAFCFGEAGTQIISQVLKEGLNVDFNPIKSGKKVMGIYGFCDIRNFTDTTEILKEKVMIFVNQVAEIVHQLTADCCGSANKNIGDAFLLVWKFENQFIKEISNKQGKIELKLKNVNRVKQICDLALICFIKILIEINKSFKLAVYRQHKDLNARMKNYKTRLGFGLHLGQSIECAMGSMFKIDASYLGTNVDMANNLEENTKTFSKELIISGDFYDYLSDDAKKYLRLLDIFKTKNGEITRLYSIDLDLENIPIEKQKDSIFKEENAEKKFEIIKQKRKNANTLYDDIVLRHKSDVWNEFINDEDDFKLVREKYPDNFIEVYNNGMEHFRNGNWSEAKNCLNSAQELLGEEDPACKRNLSYMEKSDFISPANWKGYREDEE